jgi:hypothetical protein
MDRFFAVHTEKDLLKKIGGENREFRSRSLPSLAQIVRSLLDEPDSWIIIGARPLALEIEPACNRNGSRKADFGHAESRRPINRFNV